jgi:hypothetical protein
MPSRTPPPALTLFNLCAVLSLRYTVKLAGSTASPSTSPEPGGTPPPTVLTTPMEGALGRNGTTRARRLSPPPLHSVKAVPLGVVVRAKGVKREAPTPAPSALAFRPLPA